jgi:hypothetical protein
MKKSAKVLHQFGLDCGMSTFPAFLETGLAEKMNSFHLFKIKFKKSKTYSGLCPSQGISNDTILMQIKFGRTVPLILSTDFTQNLRNNSGKIRVNNAQKLLS